ncbi:MAG: competence/damage-inducible protein A [Actinomycetota bacterium]
MTEVEIFSVGDELLRGVVQDSNSYWMAKRIAARGASLTRIQVLPDAPPLVADELRRALERKPALVLTQGGLGPTDDDRTREAIGLATGRPLIPHVEAEAIVRRRYAELASAGRVESPELHEARLRMARLPEGARALDNHVGAAPGVLLEVGATAIVALPGVPPELHWIWENSLAPELDRILGPGGFAEITVTLDLRDESSIAEMLRGLQSRHPEVYVKSRAKGFEDGEEVRVTLTAAGPDDAAARRLVEAAFADLQAGLDELRIAILQSS